MKIDLTLVSVLTLLLLSACKQEKSEPKFFPPSNDEIQTVDQEAKTVAQDVSETKEEAKEVEEDLVSPVDEGIWIVNVDRAKKIAQEKNIRLLLFFTGSDWCGWCAKLHMEVLDDENFQKELVKLFVPVKLDFPRKIKFPEEITKAYNEEIKRYGIRGFPTLIIAEADGTPIAGCGYQAGGPEPYLSMLQTILEKRTKLEEKVVKLKDGDEKAAKELYDVLEEYAARFSQYPCVKDGLKKYYDICKEKNSEISRAQKRAYSAIQEDKKTQDHINEAVEADPGSEQAGNIEAQGEAIDLEKLFESVMHLIADNQKEEAIYLIEDKLAVTGDNNVKVMLTRIKAEAQVLFNEIEAAKGSYQQCMDMCENEEAKEEFQIAIEELDPFSVAVKQSRLFVMRKDPDGAVKAIDEAIEKYDPSGKSLQKAYVYQAQSYLDTGDLEKIIFYLNKAVNVDPDSEIGKASKEDILIFERMRKNR